MARGRRDDRSARDAADRARQRRDRPRRARPGAVRRTAWRAMARATCSATAPRRRADWSRARRRAWDPLLAWARARYDVAFRGRRPAIIHRAAAARDDRAAAARRSRRSTPFALAALSPIVTIDRLAGAGAGARSKARSTPTRSGRRRTSTRTGRPRRGARTRSPPQRARRRGGATSTRRRAFLARCDPRLSASACG